MPCRHVLHLLDYEGKDESVAHAPDPSIVASSTEIYTAGAPLAERSATGFGSNSGRLHVGCGKICIPL